MRFRSDVYLKLYPRKTETQEEEVNKAERAIEIVPKGEKVVETEIEKEQEQQGENENGN